MASLYGVTCNNWTELAQRTPEELLNAVARARLHYYVYTALNSSSGVYTSPTT